MREDTKEGILHTEDGDPQQHERWGNQKQHKKRERPTEICETRKSSTVSLEVLSIRPGACWVRDV